MAGEAPAYPQVPVVEVAGQSEPAVVRADVLGPDLIEYRTLSGGDETGETTATTGQSSNSPTAETDPSSTQHDVDPYLVAWSGTLTMIIAGGGAALALYARGPRRR